METKEAVKVGFFNNNSWKMYSGKDIFLDDNIVCLARYYNKDVLPIGRLKNIPQMHLFCCFFSSFCFQYAINSLQKLFSLYSLHPKCQKDSSCKNCLNFSCKIYYSLVFHNETL